MRPGPLLVAIVAILGASSPCHAAEDPAAPPAPERLPLFSVRPFWQHAFLSHSRSLDALGISAEHAFTRRFALGISGAWSSPLDVTYPASAAAWPMSETSWEASLDARVTLLRGAAGELYVLGGPGVVRTRPVSLVDPAHRSFTFQTDLAFTASVGALMHVTSGVSLLAELHQSFYMDKEESPTIATGQEGDPNQWYGNGLRFVGAVGPRIGISVAVP